MLYIDTKKIISMAFFCLFATHTQAMEEIKKKYVHIIFPGIQVGYSLDISPGKWTIYDTYDDLDKYNLEKHLMLHKIKTLSIKARSYDENPTKKDIKTIADILKKLKFEFFMFNDFKYANLSHENFKTILISLPIDLQKLDLRGNNLTKLPPEIVGRFPKLKTLNLYDNKLQELPVIELLPELETLYIKLNNISSKNIKELREKLPNTDIIADH